MWEFLIKQDSGLYKPKSIANLEFIEQYYSFDESQSNADAMLGEILPFTYDGTNVTFDNESSLSDSGTYFPFAQIDCYNNLQMLAASNTVAEAKTALLDAIATYGVKLVRVIHISTDVPFQPLPGGVTPADLALKQDKALENSIVINTTSVNTVETALAEIANYTNYLEIDNVSNEAKYYLIANRRSPNYVIDGIFDVYNGDISRFDCSIKAYSNPQELKGVYYNNLPSDCDIIVVAYGLYAKIAANAMLCIKASMQALNSLENVMDSATTTLDEPIIASLSANGINLSEGGGGGGSNLSEINPLFLLGTDTLTID